MIPARLRPGAAWGLAAVLAWAAFPKLEDPPGFMRILSGYALLPEAALAPAALLLPWMEACAALALLLPRLRRSAALLALSLFLAFGAALGVNLARGRALECGCFGRGPARAPDAQLSDMRLALVRDGALALLALGLALERRRA